MRFLGRHSPIAALTALALLAAGSPAMAQGVTGFQLPPGTASPAPRPAGPIDPDNPIIRPRPSSSPSAAAPATPQPAPSIAASPVTSPAPRPPREAATSRTRPVTPTQTQFSPPTGPTTTESTLPSAIPTTSDTLSAQLPAPVPAAVSPAEPAQPARDWLALWPWAAGATALLLAFAAAGWWLRRRQQMEPVVEFEPPVLAKPTPVQPSARPPVPAPVQASAPVTEPLPVNPPPSASDAPITLSLAATRLSATLLNTTLLYTIELTNGGKSAIGPVTVAADMIAAHASKPVEQQLGLDGIMLEQRHQIERLKPGETASLSGEIRLPLAMVTPIRSGDAAFFVPLARFQVEAARTKKLGPLKFARNFVVGELPDITGAALRPFRLDLGPRIYSRIGQRELAQPA